jgi:hypothetical protein
MQAAAEMPFPITQQDMYQLDKRALPCAVVDAQGEDIAGVGISQQPGMHAHTTSALPHIPLVPPSVGV